MELASEPRRTTFSAGSFNLRGVEISLKLAGAARSSERLPKGRSASGAALSRGEICSGARPPGAMIKPVRSPSRGCDDHFLLDRGISPGSSRPGLRTCPPSGSCSPFGRGKM